MIVLNLPNFADNETPSCFIDETNNPAFKLLAAPNPPESLNLYRNGLRQLAGGDFTLKGNVITFFAYAAQQSDDILIACYRY